MKFKRILSSDMSGEDVKFVQEKLKEFGFHKGFVDGYFSKDTIMSVFNFQRKVGINASGSVNMQTWASILSYYDENIKSKLIIDNYRISHIGQNGFKIKNSNISTEKYYTETTTKNKIWLINNTSKIDIYDDARDWSFLNKKNDYYKYSCHFTIGGLKNSTLDGKVIKNFDEKYWSYFNSEIDEEKNKSSISIEIFNKGPIISKNNKFYTLDGLNINKSDIFECDFIGHKFWHKYTKKQLESINSLLNYLINKLNINIEGINYYSDSYDMKSISNLDLAIGPQEELINILKKFKKKDQI